MSYASTKAIDLHQLFVDARILSPLSAGFGTQILVLVCWLYGTDFNHML